MSKLPAPRLQLRWGFSDNPEYNWMCHYELVLLLGEYDIRREQNEEDPTCLDIGEWVVPITRPTYRGGGGVPCNGGYADAPFRDGAHARWDSEQLGGLPIYVIAVDGEAFPLEKEG